MKSVGLIFIAELFLCGTVHAERTIWYVHPDSALNTIQAGLDSCADNDIVLVGPGTYYENIVWPNTQGIHLTSQLGPDITIIDGNSAGTVISISIGVDTTTAIHGFTIQNGWIYSGGGGGISCENYSSPTIVGNNIVDNYASEGSGGGIGCSNNSSPIITGNTIANNHAMAGGGIYCDSASPTIADNVITGNAGVGYNSGGGGGICCEFSAAMINDNTITHNITGGYTGCGGGGIKVELSSPIIINNHISFSKYF